LLALKEVAPQIERVGFVMHPETTANIEFFKFAEAAALRLPRPRRSVCITQTK
jgi:hypothetical protein